MIRDVPLDDFVMHLVDRGEGPTILFVHGFPLDHSMWSHQLDRISSSYRCLVPDLRGFGQSRFAADEVTMHQLAADLDGLLQALSIRQPVTFCGLSMGGYVGWQFWKHFRNRLSSLILCDTRASADTEEVARGRRMMAESVLVEGATVASLAMLPKLVAPSTTESQAGLVEEVRRTIEATSPQTIAAIQRGMSIRPDMTASLPLIDVPTLALVGDHDVITPPEEMQAMAEALPEARFVRIPHAGHLAPLENPDAVNEAILEFMSDTRR